MVQGSFSSNNAQHNKKSSLKVGKTMPCQFLFKIPVPMLAHMKQEAFFINLCVPLASHQQIEHFT